MEAIAARITVLEREVRAQNAAIQDLARREDFGGMPLAQQALQQMTRELNSFRRRLPSTHLASPGSDQGRRKRDARASSHIL
ncbi:hypothetical protein [Acidisphaera sp. L21]|uniref:hypothetical protein n=1 Tax=Acidisphaera sp. L21 TaxID=1641851 RepID=UPI00131B09AF|nr:hypothetical protein [Acidisphaera sp. L21]